MAKTFEEKLKIFKKICAERPTCRSIDEACRKNGVPENFYFRFLADYSDNEEVCKLSARAKSNTAHSWFDKAEKTLDDLRNGVLDSSTARVLFDGYLRLAGKANQREYGDKIDVNNQVTMRKVQIEFYDGSDKDRAEIQASADEPLSV